MGRWTQYDEDEYRLGGLKRTAYDADTQTYTFSDSHGIRYKGVPGSEYEIAGRVKEKNIAAERPEAFADGKKRPSKINVDDTPYRFEDFLPPTAITSPTSSPSDPSAGKSTSRFLDAARRAALPKLQGVVQGLRRSATTRKVTPDDEKRGLLRTQSVASANSSVFPDEKQSFMGRGRAKTASDCETPRRTFTLRQPSTAPTPRRDSETPVRERKFSLRRSKEKEMEEKGKGRVSEMKAEEERRVVSSSSSRRSEDKVNRDSSSKNSKHSHNSSRRHSEDKRRRADDVRESPKEHTSSRSHRRYASEAPSQHSSSKSREDEQERVKRLDRLAGLPVPIAPPFNAAEPPVPETSKHHHHHHHHSSESRKEHRSDRERRHHHHERSASKLVAA